MNRLKHPDLWAILFFCIGSLIIWLPSRYLPYFWDSSGFFIHTTVSIFESGLSNLVGVDTNFAHGTLIQTGLAILWKLFDQSLLVAHVYMLVFLPLLLISTYVWLKTQLDLTMAFIGTFAIMTAPVILAEFVNVYVDLPAAALGIAAVALASTKRYRAAYIILTAAVLSKITLLTLLPYIFYKTPLKYYRWGSLPLAALGAFLVYHYQSTGWWLVEPGRVMSDAGNVSSLLHTFYVVTLNFLIRQGRIVWLCMLLVYPVLAWYRTKPFVISGHDKMVMGTLAGSLLLFTFLGEYVNRYAIYLLPFYIAAALTSLKKSGLSILPTLILATTAAVVPVFSWKPTVPATVSYQFYTPDDLSVLDSITVFRQLAVYVQYAAPEAIIYGGFPENAQLTEPIQGYVVKPQLFVPCQDFTLQSDQLQLVVMHPYSPSQIACRKLLDSYTLLPMQKFEQNGKWIELYQVDDAKRSPKTDEPSPVQG